MKNKEKFLIYAFLIVFIFISLLFVQKELFDSFEDKTNTLILKENDKKINILYSILNDEEFFKELKKENDKTIKYKELYSFNEKEYIKLNNFYYKQNKSELIIVKALDFSFLEIKIDISASNIENKNIRNKIFTEIIVIMLFLILILLFIQIFTESKLKEEAETLIKQLDEMSEQYNKYIIASKTDRFGKITFASKAFEEISGYSQSELLGKRHSLIRHEDTPMEIFEDMWYKITNGEIWEGTIKNKRKDGTSYWVKSIVTPIKNKKGKITGYNSIRYDVSSETEYSLLNKNLEHLIKEKEILLINKTKLAQIGELIAMIAHQWRQPLAAIVSTTNALKIKIIREKYEKEYFEEKIENIENFAKHLSETINDFRNFYQIKKEKENTTLGLIATNAIKIIAPSIKNNKIKFSSEFKCKTGLTTYVNEIQQVVLNLLKNAEDSIIQHKIRYPEIKVIAYEENGIYCILEVWDNGPGVPDSIKERIFDPYFSTKTNNGTGLGLYMSKTIIEDHCHGKIEIDKKAEFTIFRLKMPKDF